MAELLQTHIRVEAQLPEPLPIGLTRIFTGTTPGATVRSNTGAMAGSAAIGASGSMEPMTSMRDRPRFALIRRPLL